MAGGAAVLGPPFPAQAPADKPDAGVSADGRERVREQAPAHAECASAARVTEQQRQTYFALLEPHEDTD
ncbi:hypothetical protein GCM10009577_77300 [Streptomyces javensis]